MSKENAFRDFGADPLRTEKCCRADKPVYDHGQAGRRSTQDKARHHRYLESSEEREDADRFHRFQFVSVARQRLGNHTSLVAEPGVIETGASTYRIFRRNVQESADKRTRGR